MSFRYLQTGTAGGVRVGLDPMRDDCRFSALQTASVVGRSGSRAVGDVYGARNRQAWAAAAIATGLTRYAYATVRVGHAGGRSAIPSVWSWAMSEQGPTMIAHDRSSAAARIR